MIGVLFFILGLLLAPLTAYAQMGFAAVAPAGSMPPPLVNPYPEPGWLPTCPDCAPGIHFRDFSKLTAINGSSAFAPASSGAYAAAGFSVPYISKTGFLNGNYYAPVACTPSGYTWSNICMWKGQSIRTLTDYIAAEPILSAGTWDAVYMLHPALSPTCSIDTYCLYYSGLTALGGQAAIGLAHSSDLTHWTKYGSTPVITFNQSASAGNPSISFPIQIGNLLYMYSAITCQSGACGTALVYWTSQITDGVNWTYGGVALANARVGDWDYTADITINAPSVWLNRHGFYEMNYTSYSQSNSLPGGYGQQLGYAISADGIHWTKYRTAAVVAQNTLAMPLTGSSATFLGDGYYWEDGTNFWVGFDLAPLAATSSTGWLASMPDF